MPEGFRNGKPGFGPLKAMACAAVFAFAAVLLSAQEEAPEGMAQLLQESNRAMQEGNYQEARALLEAVLATEPSNRSARALLAKVTEMEAGANAIRNALGRAILPKAEFNDVSAREAFEYVLAEASRIGGVKPNLVWIDPGNRAGTVTLRLENIPADEVLRYVAEAAGVQLTIDRHAVKVSMPAE
jgi:tetratricopeptide (TPR) repeat protein